MGMNWSKFGNGLLHFEITSASSKAGFFPKDIATDKQNTGAI
jgi:hypothetical protein